MPVGCPRFVIILMALAALAAAPVRCAAQEGGHWKRGWILSSLALAGAEVLDLVSSRGARELNPLLSGPSGQFSMGRAAGIKAGAVSAMMGYQIFRARRSAAKEEEVYRPFTVVNSIGAAALAGVAGHNFAIRGGR